MSTLDDLNQMVRPWWRGPIPGVGDHIYADCDRLAREGGPREGLGWLPPYDYTTCTACFRRYDPAESRKRRVGADDY